MYDGVNNISNLVGHLTDSQSKKEQFSPEWVTLGAVFGLAVYICLYPAPLHTCRDTSVARLPSALCTYSCPTYFLHMVMEVEQDCFGPFACFHSPKPSMQHIWVPLQFKVSKPNHTPSHTCSVARHLRIRHVDLRLTTALRRTRRPPSCRDTEPPEITRMSRG